MRLDTKHRRVGGSLLFLMGLVILSPLHCLHNHFKEKARSESKALGKDLVAALPIIPDFLPVRCPSITFHSLGVNY